LVDRHARDGSWGRLGLWLNWGSSSVDQIKASVPDSTVSFVKRTDNGATGSVDVRALVEDLLGGRVEDSDDIKSFPVSDRGGVSVEGSNS